MSMRPVKRIVKAKPTLEGAGVHLQRAFGFGNTTDFDPFLLLDDFRNENPEDYLSGFPWHPHRGIETITYVLAGTVEHGDSLGNKGAISPGDIQWMTAGSGIIHQEMPKGDGIGHMGGFQLWANLPASQKMMDPRYREVTSDQIPIAITDKGVEIRIICGEIDGIAGPVRDIVIEPEYLDITIPPKTEFLHPTKPNHTVFAYIIEGKALFCKQKNPFDYEIEGFNYFDFKRDSFVRNENLVLFDEGEQLSISTEDDAVRFLLISGKPIKEPIAWYGPIVMNTQQELEIAFEEYNNGTFIKYKKK